MTLIAAGNGAMWSVYAIAGMFATEETASGGQVTRQAVRTVSETTQEWLSGLPPELRRMAIKKLLAEKTYTYTILVQEPVLKTEVVTKDWRLIGSLFYQVLCSLVAPYTNH